MFQKKRETHVHLAALLFLLIMSFLAIKVMSVGDSIAQGELSTRYPFGPPVLYPCADIKTFTGINTRFDFYCENSLPGKYIYSWDYDGDGSTDWSSRWPGESSHQYAKDGLYQAAVTVYDGETVAHQAYVTVFVGPGFGQQSTLPKGWFKSRVQKAQGRDKIAKNKYAIIAGQAAPYETWFFDYSVKPWYYFLNDSCDIHDTNIYVIYSGPVDSTFQDQVDFSNSSAYYYDSLFYLLSHKINASTDELYIIFTGHGLGLLEDYNSPYGVHYDSGENVQDLYEGTVHWNYNREAYTKFNYYTYYKSVGMNKWTLTCNDQNMNFYDRSSDINIWRHKRLSKYTNLKYYDSTGAIKKMSNSDIYVQRVHYLPLGDIDRNCVVEPDETWDWDEDGWPPVRIDTLTDSAIYDEGDWDSVAYRVDTSSIYGYCLGGDTYAILYDSGLDNKMEVDINYDTASLSADGRDSDNDGQILSIDFNDDNDKTDSLAIDESAGGIYDDFLKMWIDSLDPSHTTILMQTCFSGGFVDDLSRDGLVIGTSCEKRDVSTLWKFLAAACSTYTNNTVSAAADDDSNGCVSLVELFNYAAPAQAYWYGDPQYDDNSDFIGHEYPIPNGGDGDYGSWFGFMGMCLEPDTSGYVYGDANGDTYCNVGDVVFLNNYIFSTGSPPDPLNAGDPNSSCAINVGDPVFLINYIYKGGEVPGPGCVE